MLLSNWSSLAVTSRRWNMKHLENESENDSKNGNEPAKIIQFASTGYIRISIVYQITKNDVYWKPLHLLLVGGFTGSATARPPYTAKTSSNSPIRAWVWGELWQDLSQKFFGTAKSTGMEWLMFEANQLDMAPSCSRGSELVDSGSQSSMLRYHRGQLGPLSELIVFPSNLRYFEHLGVVLARGFTCQKKSSKFNLMLYIYLIYVSRISMYFYVFLCISMYFYVFLCISMYFYVFLCISMYFYILHHCLLE